MSHFATKLQPGVREDPRLVRESVESTRASVMMTGGFTAPSRHSGYTGSPTMAASSGSGAEDLILEPITWEGRTYLLDQRTKAVYADTPTEQYPRLLGKWQGGRLVPRERNIITDLFSNLDQYLKQNQVRFSELFTRFDRDASGALDANELTELVQQLVQGVSGPELKYIMAMLDSSGDGRVTQKEFLGAVKASLEAAGRLQAERNAGATSGSAGTISDVQSVLLRVSDYLRSNAVNARSLFERFDTNGNGRLEPGELARFFAAAVPEASEAQLRYLMAHMYELDANGDGTVTYAELLYALRVANVQRRPSQGPDASVRSPAAKPPLSRQMTIAAQPGGAEWLLEDVVDPNTGRHLKRDPATGLVYSEVVPGEWPQVVGFQDANGVLQLTQRRQDGGLFAALDTYLRSNRVKFQDMFNKFDVDNSKYLDMAELRELVREILPGFSEGQLNYFQALLDINGDGKISFEEMMGVAKKCLAAERAAAESGGARDPEVKAALDRFQAYLVQYSTIAYQHFEAADVARRGHLKFPEFARFLHHLIPDLQESQLRAIISYLYAQDVDQSGVVSWLMLARFMRVPQLASLAGGGAHSAAPGNQAGGLRRSATSARNVTFANDTWELEEIQWQRETYLLDPHTNRIYQEAQAGGWPRLVGTCKNGAVVLQERTMALKLFDTLDAYLKEHKLRCRKVFDHFDSGAKGWLSPDELGQLVDHFLPGQVSKGDVKYFQVMVDRNQDGHITYEEFLEAARECKAEEAAARDRTSEARKALQTVSDYIRRSNTELRTAFGRFDVNRNGLLEPRELALLLRTCVPDLSPTQLRYILAHLHTFDLDGDGCLSFREFCIAMRGVDAKKGLPGGRDEIVPGDFVRSKSAIMGTAMQQQFLLKLGAAGGGGISPTSSRSGSPLPSRSRPGTAQQEDDQDSEWEVQEFQYDGKALLLDPRTQRVYSSPDGGSWPQLLGKLENGRVTRAVELRPNELWNKLDVYLRSNKVKLRELFSAYDSSGAGSLRPNELGRLIRDIMPDVSRAELYYFLAMMDANGDGSVSYDEFVAAAKDSLRATQQLTGVVGGAAGGAFPPDVLTVLDELSSRLAEQPALSKRMFNSADRNGDGALDLSEAGRFLRNLLPDLNARALQYVLSYLAQLDLDGSGTLTFSEMMTGLHALQARGPTGATYRRSFSVVPSAVAIGAQRPQSSAQSRMSPAAEKRASTTLLASSSMSANRAAYSREWELHEWRYGGAQYLLDPVTNLVYSEVRSSQDWPELVGRKVGNVLQPLDSSATMTFFKNLDAFLKAEQVKFSQLFEAHDGGRKGHLDRRELAALIRRVMPEATEAQVRFLAVVLDENNDHVFTQKELLGAARKVVELLREQRAGGSAGAVAPSQEVSAVLDRFSRFLLDNMDHAQSLFQQLDSQRAGYLDYDGVAAFFRRLAPRLAAEELQQLLAHVHMYDVDGMGQVTFSELLRAMRAADLQSTHGRHAKGWARRQAAVGKRTSVSPSAEVSVVPSTVHLEAFSWGDRNVLVDRANGMVLSRPNSDTDWPQPIGRLAVNAAGREFVVPVQPDAHNFFKRLDSYLRDNRVRLRSLFDAADADHSGALDFKEMGRLVRRVMPEATAAQVQYFLAMLDVDGVNRVTYDQFVDVCRQALLAEQQFDQSSTGGQSGLSPGTAEALKRLSRALSSDLEKAVRLFKQADRDGSGRLEPREAALLMRSVLPEITRTDLRAAIAVLFRNMDHDGDGTLSLQEFLYAMRALELQTPDRALRAGTWQGSRSQHVAQSPPSPAAREEVLLVLELQEVTLLGQRYLHSPYNNVVYEYIAPQGRGAAPPWPKAVGILSNDRRSVNQAGDCASSANLFTSLDNHLKKAKVRFSDFFAKYDHDRSGRLEPWELGQLVSDLLGPDAASPADAAYCVALLDLDGSGAVSESEFLSVARDFLALERRAADLRAAASEEIRRCLDRASKYLQADREGNYELFLRSDVNKDGRLNLRELVPFLKELLRGQVTQRDIQCLLTHAHGCDVAKADRFSYNDVLVAFRAVPVRYPGGTLRPGFADTANSTAMPAAPSDQPVVAPAKLQSFMHGSQMHYRDPQTGMVYRLVDDARGRNPRLELVSTLRTTPGSSAGGRVQVLGPSGRDGPSPAKRLFEALDAALKESRVRLRDVFDRYDYNRNGRLEARELGRLVRDLLPTATDVDFRYLLAVLDYDGDSAVTYDELVAAVRECWTAGRAVSGHGEGGTVLAALLERVAKELGGQRDAAWAVFDRFDRNKDGRLEPAELSRFLRACMPELGTVEIRHLVIHLHSLDTNGDGALSFNEMLHGLYSIELELPDGRRLLARYLARAPAASPSHRSISVAAAPATLAAVPGSGKPRPYPEQREWRLELWHCATEGRDLWLDRETGLCYQPAASREEGWPVLLGARTREGGVQRLESTISGRFFSALDQKLRVERLRLSDMLGDYDRDGNAGLDERELGRLARNVMGEELSVQAIKYLMAALDLDGDRLVSRNEVITVFEQLGSTGSKLAGLQDPRLVELLNRLSSAISRGLRPVWERFCRADVNGTGGLEPRELRWFLTGVLPGCSPEDQRLLLTYLHLVDVNCNGRLEWHEMLAALRVVPVRTPAGLMRPPSPPFRTHRITTPAAHEAATSKSRVHQDDYGYAHREHDMGPRSSGGEVTAGSRGRRQWSSEDEESGQVASPPEVIIPDREFVMELRASKAAVGRRSSDGHKGSRASGALRDPDTGLLYTPPEPSASKGAWPALVAYEDPKEGRRLLPPLHTWSFLLDLEAAVQADPDRLMAAAKRKVPSSRSSGSGGLPQDTLDTRTAASLLTRFALEGGQGASVDPWIEHLTKGMLDVMHDRGVRLRKLPRDVEALASAYRLLTDPREGVALLRDIAAGISKEYRQVARAMRTRLKPTGATRSQYGKADGASSDAEEGLLELADIRDVLQDTIPEVLGGAEPAMAALLYLLYHCPHRLSRGAQVALGWKDIFKTLRAVKCKHPDGTSRVGQWDAAEVSRRRTSSSTPSSSRSSSRSSSPASANEEPRKKRSGHGERSLRQHGTGSSGSHRQSSWRNEGTMGEDHRRRRSGDSAYRQGRGMPSPPPQMYGMDPAAAAAAGYFATGDPATALQLQHLAAAGGQASYQYRAPAPAEDPAVQAVRLRMANDLRMSKSLQGSDRRLNISLNEMARRKLHPSRRLVTLALHKTQEGKQFGLDEATGLVYNLSTSEDYPELAGKLRPSGELRLGGGSSASLHGVFNSLRTLDEAMLVQLFNAYDTNGNGTLELKELMALLRDVAGLPYAEAGLVQALLDADLSNSLTLHEWIDGIRTSTNTLNAASTAFGAIGAGAAAMGSASKAQRTALTVLAAVSAQVSQDLDVFWAAYARADRDGNGYLDVAELARFFKDLFRDMPPYDVRLLVAYCFTADMEKDGMVRPDELLQHLRAIPLKSPTGVLHKPGFRIASTDATRSGLMDSIPSAKANARLSYAKAAAGLTVIPPDPSAGLNDSLASKLPAGPGFPMSPHGAGSVMSFGAPGTPQGPASLAASQSFGPGFAPPMPYMPMPMAAPYMPYMMPGTQAVATGPGGSMVGFLMPYQPDMYQALYDRLVARPSGGGLTDRRSSRASDAAHSEGAGSPLPSDYEAEEAAADHDTAPPLRNMQPPQHSRGSSHGSLARSPSYRHQPRSSYPPPPYSSPSGHAPPPPYQRYDLEPGASPQLREPPVYQHQHLQHTPPTDFMPPENGSGFGVLMEMHKAVGASPQVLRSHFRALSRTSSVGTRRSTGSRYGDDSGHTRTVHVLPKAALGQLVDRLSGGTLHEPELRYASDMLAWALPYGIGSYTEDEVMAAIHQCADCERAVAERRLPPDVAAMAGHLAEDIGGNTAFAASARSAFQEAGRGRRGSLPLWEALRMLQRLTTLPPHASRFLLAGLAHYAATALQGAVDISLGELAAALGQLSYHAAPAYDYPAYAEGHTASPQQKQQQPPAYGSYPSLRGSQSGIRHPRSPVPPQSPSSHRDPKYPSIYDSNPGRDARPGGSHGRPTSGPYSSRGSPYHSPHSPTDPHGAYRSARPAPPYAPYPGQGALSPHDYPHGSLPGSPNGASNGYYKDSTGGPGGAMGNTAGAAYMMWTHTNRNAVVDRYMTHMLQDRTKDLEAQAAALDKEVALKQTLLTTSSTLQKTEEAQAEVLKLIRSYTGAGTPPVSVKEVVDRIDGALQEALQLARAGGTAGQIAALHAGDHHPEDFDSLLDSLTSAKWVSGQPVSLDTLRTALALRRDAFMLKRAHATAMANLEAKQQSQRVQDKDVQQAMSIQLQLLQAQLQQQTQELQHRLMREAQGIAAAAAVSAHGMAGGGGLTHGAQTLPGLLLPAAYAATVLDTGAFGTGLASSPMQQPPGSLGTFVPVASTTPAPTMYVAAGPAFSPPSPPPAAASVSPRLVFSPTTWQMEPLQDGHAGHGAAPRAGAAARYPAPPRD